MSESRPLTVRPATADAWPVIEEFFTNAVGPCLCQYWRHSAGGYSRASEGERWAALRAQVEDEPAPGIIAEADGRMVGWCGLWPRHRLERLVRSRTIPAVDELPVWSIVCFAVRVGYRRRGVARALLAGAVEYARAAGAPALEAYPVDSGGRRLDVAFAYVGLVGMFEAAGFRRVAETDARSAGRPRILMRLDLRGRPSP
ncbi:MAG TPA: GNAT family N-acetyltransferase [Candidatus Limnocylindrales bacterium]|nr:GNAT family N-acetyltransferase [Candidatus Limnocylindrales bacterium]